MVDPISVAASIVGLITAASKISESLSTFIKNVKNAPRLAHDILSEVSEISASLSQLQNFLFGPGMDSKSHEELLIIDQIIVALSNCVLVFAELEGIVEPFRTANLIQPGTRVRWAFKEQKIERQFRRLKSCRETLGLMLLTMTW